MAEYYSKEAVVEFIRSYRHSTDVAFHMEEHLYEIPAADVVAVIRCKDCRFFKPDTFGDCWCSAKSPGVSKGMYSPSGDSYCSDAERK